jgi:hypothetical protein
MAVVQISRIQIRRGRESSGTGLPQLAGGEFGWAVDTQSLYIGNGAVVEGAPAVGNTKIITEHDNIFSLLGTYEYGSGLIETGEISRVTRNLAARLDDRVSLRSFGAVGDGGDTTAQLQKALYELYLNSANKTNPQSRVILFIEPGLYVISSTVYIPPYVTLVGAGRDKTVFETPGGFNMFETISSNTTYTGVIGSTIPVKDPTLSYAESARGINISGMTLRATATSSLTNLLVLNSTRDSRITDVKFIGPRLTGAAADTAIYIKSKSDAVQSQFNRFTDCEFVGLGCAIKSNHSIHHNDIEFCTFDRLVTGIEFAVDPVVAQGYPNDNTIKGCYFEDIDRHGIIIALGTRNLTSQNKFGPKVGTEGGSEATAAWPIIKFGETGNISLDDHFDRTYNLSIKQEFIVSEPYVPDVEGPAFVDYGFTETVEVDGSSVPNVLFRVPAESTKTYYVEYVYNTTIEGRFFSRAGTLTMVINRENNIVTLSDEYDYVGNDTYEQTLKFSAALVQFGSNYTVQVRQQNPLDQGILTYRIKSRS